MMDYFNFRIASRRADENLNSKVHWFSHLFEKRLSYWLYRLGFKADVVTVLFGVLGVSGAFLLTYNVLLAYLFWRLHILFDMADGNIARACNQCSKRGVVLDILNHGVINTLHIFLGAQILGINDVITAIYLSSYILFFLVKYLPWQFTAPKKSKSLNNNVLLIILKDLIFIEGWYVILIYCSFFDLNLYLINGYVLVVSFAYFIHARYNFINTYLK